MSNDFNCPICGYEYEAISNCGVFVDGRRYGRICHTCARCIRYSGPWIPGDLSSEWVEYDNEEIVHLNSLKDMAADGWASPFDQKWAKDSLDAIKQLLKKAKKKWRQEEWYGEYDSNRKHAATTPKRKRTKRVPKTS